MINKNLYAPHSPFISFFFECLIWGGIGILLGILNNNLVVFVSNKLNISSSTIQNTLQITLCSLLLTIVHFQFNYFGWSWQNLTPGLFFVSFFFGVQFKMISNIQNDFALEDKVQVTVNKLLEKNKNLSISESVKMNL
jgi:hypothetical protein